MQINGLNGQIKVVVVHKMFWAMFMILKDINFYLTKQSNMILAVIIVTSIENIDEEIELK